MSLTLPLPATRWNQIDDALHVASRDGEFFGYADRTDDGSYIAFDRFSSPIGRYPDLANAKAALDTVTTDPANVTRNRARRRIPFVAATVAGLAATTLALTAGTLLPLLP